jgi:broad specificity phosphatase PhoE
MGRKTEKLRAVRPALMVTSPCMATRETATLPRSQEYAHLSIDQGLAEFRYLDATFADGSTRAERRARSGAYWQRQNPHFHDGGDAGSFSDPVERIRNIMSAYPEQNSIMMTHGIVIAAALLLIQQPAAPLQELMYRFTSILRENGVVGNCARVRLPGRGRFG